MLYVGKLYGEKGKTLRGSSNPKGARWVNTVDCIFMPTGLDGLARAEDLLLKS